MIDLANLGKVLLLIAVFLPVRFAQDWTFYPDTAFIEQMNLRVENSLVSSVPYHLFWFGQHDRTIQLHCNSLLGNHPLELYALTKRETIVKAPVAQLTGGFRLDKDYSGTIGATLPRLQVDFNQDGRLEKLQLTAKIDTLFAQPFHPIRTAFKDPRIPLEVCFKGDRSILILLNGQPLRQETIRLVSRRGYGCNSDRTAITDSAGMLQVDDVRDLRTGISISYQGRDQVHYITSYRLEANSMFTKRHQRALIPLVKELQWAVGLIGLIIILRRVCCGFGRGVLPILLSEQVQRLVGKFKEQKL